MRKLFSISLLFLAIVAAAQSTRPVVWKVNGQVGGNAQVGIISSSGVYTAPLAVPTPSTVTVGVCSLEDPTKCATAAVTIVAPPPPPITVTVLPVSATVTAGTTRAFTQQVSGGAVVSTGTAVGGSAAGGGASNPSVGTTDMATNFIPPTKYQSFVSTCTCDGIDCDIVTAAAHGLTTGDTVRLGNTGACMGDTPTGTAVTVTVSTATAFEYSSTVGSGSSSAGYVVWNPAPSGGNSYVDPTFGSTVKRLFNREVTSPAYYCPDDGSWQNFSPDESKLLCRENDQNQWFIVNHADSTIWKTTANINGCTGIQAGSSNPRWLTDNTLWYKSGNTMYSCNLTTLARTSLRAVTGCDASSLTIGNHGDLDDSKDQIALQCGKDSDTTFDYWVYKISTDAEGTRYNLASGTDFPQVVQLSTGGTLKDFVLNFGANGTGTTQGIWLVNGTTGATIRQITQYSQHSFPLVSGGVEWWVSEGGGGGPVGCTDGIVAYDIAAVVTTKCVVNAQNLGRGFYGGHTNSGGTNPGWAGLSIMDTRAGAAGAQTIPSSLTANWATKQLLYHGEEITCKYDTGSAAWLCWRIAHSYNRSAGQTYGGKISPNGTYMAWRTMSNAVCFNASPACPNGTAGFYGYKETAISRIR